MQSTPKIRVLRRGPCGENKVCPTVAEVDGRPHLQFVVSKLCTEPGEAAAFAGELKAGEVIGWMPDGFLPVGSPLLDRTRRVTGAGVRADRQYVISSLVTDEDDLAMFGELFDPETEQLGTTLAIDRELQGV